MNMKSRRTLVARVVLRLDPVVLRLDPVVLRLDDDG